MKNMKPKKVELTTFDSAGTSVGVTLASTPHQFVQMAT